MGNGAEELGRYGARRTGARRNREGAEETGKRARAAGERKQRCGALVRLSRRGEYLAESFRDPVRLIAGGWIEPGRQSGSSCIDRRGMPRTDGAANAFRKTLSSEDSTRAAGALSAGGPHHSGSACVAGHHAYGARDAF